MHRKPDPLISRSNLLIGSAIASLIMQLAVIYFMGLHKDFEYIFILVIVVNLFGILMLVYRMRKEQARSESLKQMSRRLGLIFTLSSEGEFFEGFKLYQGGPVRNLLEGRLDGGEVKIFGYSYTSGSGENSQTINSTVLLLENSHLDLPDFFCRPESFWEKKLFHKDEDIDFSDEPEFSKAYYLTGEDEERIRQMFSHEVMNFFVDKTRGEDLTVEGRGNSLALYQKGIRVEPKELRALMDEGREVLKVFRDASKHRRS